MSMTGAAACSKAKFDARDDKFTVSCKKTSCFNVLSNDKGVTKVITTGYIKTAKGGKVYMQSNGKFCYVKPVACSNKYDSFKYTAVCKAGTRDTAKVTLKLK